MLFVSTFSVIFDQQTLSAFSVSLFSLRDEVIEQVEQSKTVAHLVYFHVLETESLKSVIEYLLAEHFLF